MPQFQSHAVETCNEDRHLDDFTLGYIEAAYFTSVDDGDPEPGEAPFTPDSPLDWEALFVISADCQRFQQEQSKDLECVTTEHPYSMVQAGRDFWFTRNGHGAGFWDRNEITDEELRDKLSEAARSYGQQDLLMGDQGEVGVFPGLPGDFVRSYIEAAYRSLGFTGPNDPKAPLPAVDVLQQIISDCDRFRKETGPTMITAKEGKRRYSTQEAAQDFWESRNHCGSWIEAKGDILDEKTRSYLAEAARCQGRQELTVGGDGLLHAVPTLEPTPTLAP